VAACLSNLRQLGIIHTNYVAENKGYVVPCDLGDGPWRPGGASPDANGYKTIESWATILVCNKYLPYPATVDYAAPSESNALYCPSALPEFLADSTITSGLPTSRQHAEGAKAARYQSKTIEPGRYVYSWYGINGTSGSDKGIPCRRWPSDGTNPNDPANPPKPIGKITDIRKSSEVVFLFDGISINLQSTNANRLNARHNKRTSTNILFFDGHADTFPTASLPGGAGDANPASNTFSLTNLKDPKYAGGPKWRTDY
jgi:prepilin-type processing-associated H-X9-DG protein